MKKPGWAMVPAVMVAAAAGELVGGACGGEGPARPPRTARDGPLPAASGVAALWPRGRTAWTWTAEGAAARGPATLLVGDAACGPRWSWDLGGRPPPRGGFRLVPADTTAWLPLAVPAAAGDPDWLPLPRVPVASPAYGHAVAFLAALTGPRFGGVVTHWPQRPVPVRIPAAVSGAVDLAACLRAAVAVWNAGADPPWFACVDTAAWGVRLVHMAGRDLSPPLAARITRLDAVGRPLRVQIVVGDTYDEPRDSIYAVRGFVHELGHALFLWGHSADRTHVLWGRGPPLVAAPAADERLAARLLHALPEGLDLGRYGTVTPP